MLPIQRLKKSNTIENLWLYILSALKNTPAHAYELRKKISDNFNFKIGQITTYRVLYRLETNGFVKSVTKDRKRVYQATKKGMEELKKALSFFNKIHKDLS